MQQKNILYITRKFPPSIGGMQRQSYQFNEALRKKTKVYTISWGGSNLWLFVILPFFFIKSCTLLLCSKIDIIQLGDLLLSPLGLILKAIFKKPVIAVAHGRDSEYNKFFYQKIIIFSLSRIDKVVCVSQNLKMRLINKGITQRKLEVIPNGIEPDSFNIIDKEKARIKLEESFDLNSNGKAIISSVCRLVKKKGLAYFIENIFPAIVKEHKEVIYLIAGDGPEEGRIRAAIEKLGYSDKVKLLGLLKSKKVLQLLYSASDVFVMPNRSVQNDVEGFGIVALEAGLCNLPIVAFGVDGVTQAIIDGKTGILIKEDKPEIFAKEVLAIIKNDKSKMEFFPSQRQYVIDNFSWDKISTKYLQLYNDIIC